MHKFLIFFVGGLLGVIGGFAVGIFAYPYIFLANIVAAETLENAAAKTVVATGTFIYANPSDPVHYGRGELTVYNDAIQIGADFEVGPGPKFHVYLVPDAPVTPDTAIDKSMYVDLGRLRAFKGSQVFKIPSGADLNRFKSVVICCEQFGVLISPATLDFKKS